MEASMFAYWSYYHNPTLQTSFLLFLLVYLLSYFFLVPGWGPKNRPYASSCLTSLAHGTPAAIMAVRAILNQPSRSFANPNTSAQSSVLKFSTGYFLVDLLHYLVFFPHDVLFIVHHVATLFVLVTCFYIVRHGAYGILVLLILAEVTSPCQNTWSLARTRRDMGISERYYRFISPCFYTFYSVVRGILAPIFIGDLVVFYASGLANGSIPKWAWISWIVVIVSGTLVSIIWVWNNWKKWSSERTSNSVEKKDS